MTALSTHPTQQASAWLADFNHALTSGDIDASMALFDADGYWRGLVSFTWNSCTQEGPDAIRTMLQARLGYSEQPCVVIVGGSQGGIALGARLRRLGVPAIIVEKKAKPGDSWRKRCKSLCLHDPVWCDHLPYLPFTDDWPVFAPKDKRGDWLEMYTKVMELNCRGSTLCKKARYDEGTGTWEVQVERNGQPVTLRPKELVEKARRRPVCAAGKSRLHARLRR